MTRASLLLIAVCVAFLLGWAHEPNVVSAAKPDSCPKYQCVEWYHWWAGNGDVVITGAYSVVGAQSIKVALLDTFANFSDRKAPQVPSTGVVYDARTLPGCIPLCGLHPNTTNWQAPQIVAPLGPLGVKPIMPDDLFLCTVLGPGANGNTTEPPPLSEDQSNQANPGRPPGVPADTPAG